MPKEMERKLRAQGRKKGLSGARLDAYVYGTMRKTGWTPSTQKAQKKKRTKKKSTARRKKR